MKNNIILIVIDAFRPKNLSLFGYQKETDKNLKEIAREGIIFRNFFSSSNATAPSLMSIFTGRLPSNHGIVHQFPFTSDEEIKKMYRERNFWLPSFLKNKGYQTIAIDWIGMFFKEGFDYYKEREDWQGENKVSTEFSPAQDTMDLAISQVEKAKQPFFLFAHFWDTHFPFLTTDFKTADKVDPDKIGQDIQNEIQREYFKKRVQVSGNEVYTVQGQIDKYDAAISGVDRQIGKLRQHLKGRGLWNETIFMVLGDHGTSLTEHDNYFNSASLFDENIRAPLIASFPRISQKNIESFVQNTDLAPTILELIGENQNEWNFDGKSFLSLVKTGKEMRDEALFFDGLGADIKGSRTKKRKIIEAPDPQCYLCKTSHHETKEEYDLIDDPQELKNILINKK